MSQLNRVMGEQALQVLAIAVSMFDRLVLTAILYRVWGAENFEAWTIAASIAGMSTLLELGFSLYMANKLVRDVETGQDRAADRTIAIANVTSLISGILMALGAATLLLFWTLPEETKVLRSEITWGAILLGLQSGLRVTSAPSGAVYRAYRQYSRYISLMMCGDLMRVLVTAIVVMAGGGIVLAALSATMTALLIHVVAVRVDAYRRFGSRSIVFAIPTGSEFRQSLAVSAAIGAQTVPLNTLAYLPVLVLNSRVATAGVISAFVLQRTLSGLPRSLLQSLGTIVGQECARSIAANDIPAAINTLRLACNAFSVMSGLAVGILLAGGRELMIAWTNDASIFNFKYMLVAAAPMLLASASVVMHNVLACTNKAYLPAAGRMLQLALTLMIVGIAPTRSPTLDMFLALSLAELIGYVPIAYYAGARLLPDAGFMFHLRQVLLTIMSAVIGAVITLASIRVIEPQSTLAIFTAFVLVAIGCAASFWGLALTPAIRREANRKWINPMLRAFKS
ncbi:hypothetical protein [Mesorhizobium prunaredense]|nr:hypothetical protein [Mesorhizobium prunaredense]